MSALERNDLEKILSIIFDVYNRNKLVPEADKKSIISAVADRLEANGPVDDSSINNRDVFANVKKLLADTLANHAMGAKSQNKDLVFDPALFFKSYAPSEQDKLKGDLKKEILKFLVAFNMKLEPGKQKSNKELDNIADKLADDLATKHMRNTNEANLSQNKDAVDLFTQLNMTLCSLYGGIDPRFAGMPIMEEAAESVLGNLEGFVNNAPAGGLSYMSKANTVDAGGYDYTGSEAFEIANAISSDAMSPELERELVQEGYISAPEATATNKNWPPKLHP